MLARVGIGPRQRLVVRVPSHQFSGGMRQRAMIDMAPLMCNSGMIIERRPTTAPDVTIQAQIPRVAQGCRPSYGHGPIFFFFFFFDDHHNLGVIAAWRIAWRSCIGKVVRWPSDNHSTNRWHPTRSRLLGSMPKIGKDVKRG